MAVRDDFTAGEVLAAADLNDTFASKLPYSYGTATPSTTDSGFLWYDSNSTPAAPKFWDGAAFQALTSGKILQVQSAQKTDTAAISTSGTSFTSNVSGLDVAITPSKTSSTIMIMGFVVISRTGDNPASFLRLVRNGSAIAVGDAASNRALVTVGSQSFFTGTPDGNNRLAVPITIIDAPATTSAITYGVQLYNSSSSTQTLYVNRSATDTDSANFMRTVSSVVAMEVSA